MAAPIGNNFWTKRSKHGRDKIFETPADLWEAACEYFEHVDDNPYKKMEQARNGGGKRSKEVSADGIEDVPTGLVELPVMKPYTLQGLCSFMHVHTTYLNEFEEGLKGKTDERSKGFSQIIKEIREIIYNQKFSGAAAGFFNQNIIARDLGLVDKKEEKQVFDEPVIIAFNGEKKAFGTEVGGPKENQNP